MHISVLYLNKVGVGLNKNTNAGGGQYVCRVKQVVLDKVGYHKMPSMGGHCAQCTRVHSIPDRVGLLQGVNVNNMYKFLLTLQVIVYNIDTVQCTRVRTVYLTGLASCRIPLLRVSM